MSRDVLGSTFGSPANEFAKNLICALPFVEFLFANHLKNVFRQSRYELMRIWLSMASKNARDLVLALNGEQWPREPFPIATENASIVLSSVFEDGLPPFRGNNLGTNTDEHRAKS